MEKGVAMRWFRNLADIDPQENLEDFVACSGCKERGYVGAFSAENNGNQYATPCPKCGGSGTVHVNEQYNWERSRRWEETKLLFRLYKVIFAGIMTGPPSRNDLELLQTEES